MANLDTPLILSLETATLGGSVFLGRGPVELASRTGDPQVSQSSSLLSDINHVLVEAKVTLKDLDVLACALGPGSFTGLRIGIATLKALAATLERPCVGIPTLSAVAFAAGPGNATISLLPAGRGELFAQMFSVSPDGTVTDLDQAAHLSPERLLEKYGALTDVRWAGNGAQLQREFLERNASQHGFALAEETNESVDAPGRIGWRLAAPVKNLAQPVAALALQAFQAGRLQSAQALSAIYVRPSDAELNQQCR